MVNVPMLASSKYPALAKVPCPSCALSGAVRLGVAARFHIISLPLGRRKSAPCFFYSVAQPNVFNHFKKTAWSIRSGTDNTGIGPSTSNGTDGRTRLIRVIQNLQTKIDTRFRELKKNLPMKLLFFLIGFYCATAFATVIGQTGDWDILSAALAVIVVEGIGALMYRESLPLFSKVRGLITMFNFWKAGLSLGLFLDSFKYEIENFIARNSPFNFEWDIFSQFF